MAKLGDLMLVKALEGTQAERVTRPGETVGDIPYLSPEQLLSQNDVDFRSDIYSLGATIYAAVTGKPPIEGKSLAQTITRIESQQPVDPRKLNLSIPPQFAAVILQMLEKEPSERFDTPAALVRRLEKVAKATEQPPVPVPAEDDVPFAGGEVSWRSFSAWVCEIPWPVRQKLMIGAGLIIVAITLGSFLGSHLASPDSGSQLERKPATVPDRSAKPAPSITVETDQPEEESLPIESIVEALGPEEAPIER